MTDNRADKPSNTPPGQRYLVRIYLDDEDDPQVYEHVKHVWWTANCTVLTILHYYEDGSHRYVRWLRERIRWYEVTREAPSQDQST